MDVHQEVQKYKFKTSEKEFRGHSVVRGTELACPWLVSLTHTGPALINSPAIQYFFLPFRVHSVFSQLRLYLSCRRLKCLQLSLFKPLLCHLQHFSHFRLQPPTGLDTLNTVLLHQSPNPQLQALWMRFSYQLHEKKKSVIAGGAY